MYSIGQVSEMFGLPISTLRYYDKEGLFPNLSRTSGARRFGDIDIELLRIIECLKISGLEIKDIKKFIELLDGGPSTYAQRKELLQARKDAVEQEIERLRISKAMLEFKCWYYDTALADGNEKRLSQMIPDNLPEGIQELYDMAHKALPADTYADAS